MHKKLLAILLSVVLLVVCIVPSFVFQASADENNIITNGDFEKGTVDSNGKFNKSTSLGNGKYSFDFSAEGWTACSTPYKNGGDIIWAYVTDKEHHNGKYSLGMSIPFRLVSREVKVTKNTQYNFSFWCKVPNGKTLNSVEIAGKDTQGSIVYTADKNGVWNLDSSNTVLASKANIKGAKADEWFKVDMSFISGNYEYITISFHNGYGENVSGSYTTVYVDDLELYAGDTLYKPEKAEGGYTFPESATIKKDEAKTDASFVAVPTQGYKFSKWVWVDNQNKEHDISLQGNAKVDGSKITVEATKNSPYKLKPVFTGSKGTKVINGDAEDLAVGERFNTMDNTPAKAGMWYAIEGTPGAGGGGPHGVDRIPITVTDQEAHSGTKSFKVDYARCQVIGRDITGLKANTKYLLQIYFKTYNKDINIRHVTVLDKSVKDAVWNNGQMKSNSGLNLWNALNNYRAAHDYGYSADYTCYGKYTDGWQRCAVEFTTGSETNVAFQMKIDGSIDPGTFYMDDLDVYEVSTTYTVASSAGRGGSVISLTNNEKAISGQPAAFIAKPMEDSFADDKDEVKNVEFRAWVDENGNTLSTDELYYIPSVNKDTKIKAEFDVVNVGIQSVGLGGTAAISRSGLVPKGKKIEFKATPYAGNTFAGWYDGTNDKLLSTEADWIKQCDTDLFVVAKFNGKNKPAVERLMMNGFEGSTLQDSKSPITITTSNDDPTFGPNGAASFELTKDRAFEGKGAWRWGTRWRNGYVHMAGLNKNSDYKITYYYYLNKNGEGNDQARVVYTWVGEHAVDVYQASQNMVFFESNRQLADSGWQKVDIYFNSGDYSELEFGIRYYVPDPPFESGRPNFPYAYDQECIYLDNLELWEYGTMDSLQNTDFSNGLENWSGTGTYSEEAGAAKLTGDTSTLGQVVKVNNYTQYKLSYKVKSTAGTSVTGGAVELEKALVNCKTAISSLSYNTTSSTEYKEVNVYFTTAKQSSLKIAFTNNGSGTSYIDDVKLELDTEDKSQSIIENIDFETDRFAINDFYGSSNVYSNPNELTKQSDAFEIYTAKSENDAFVHSGKKSLKIRKRTSDEKDAKLLQAWNIFPTIKGGAYKITFWYTFDKVDGGVYFAGDYNEIYSQDTSYMAEDSKVWHKVSFNVANSNGDPAIRAVVGNLPSLSFSDVYVDDITFQLAQPTVTDSSPRALYTENLYNAFDNEGFEEDFDFWGTMPSAYKVLTGTKNAPAFTENKYLHAGKTNNVYKKTVDIEAGAVCYFAASLRGSNTSNSFIGLTMDAEGTKFLLNDNEEVASKLTYTSYTGSWQRRGFRFVAPASGKITLVINTSDGDLDIDNIMLYTDAHKYTYDPNDYSIYNYDFNDMSNAIVNGGYGDQPYFKGNLNKGTDDEVYSTVYETVTVVTKKILDDYGNEISSEEEEIIDNGEVIENPTTGDNSFAAYAIMLVGLVLSAGVVIAMIVLGKKGKGGKINE